MIIAGTLNLSQLGAALPAGTYIIISCIGSRTGTFNTVNKPTGWVVNYTPNAITVTVPSLLLAQSGGEDILSAKNTGFILYPNPVKDLLMLQVPLNTKGDIIISDATGKIIFSINIVNKALVKMRVATLPPGVYIVKFYSNLKMFTEKFIKE